MSGFDLSSSIAAESGNNSEATTTDTEESEVPFEANESTEGYALFANSSSLVSAMSQEVFDNDAVYSLVSWGDDLGDYEDKDTEDLNGQQKLDLLHLLAKGTFGGRQSELNEGYGMGWDTSGDGPPKVYDNDEVDHVPYLDVFSELPAFETATLDGGEIEQLESEGLDMDNFGFDRSVEGPQLPVINGERVPILFEEGDEVVRFLELMDTIDFDEVTYCEENGSLQGTPTLGPDEENVEVSTENPAEEDSEVNLAANPEAISEVNVSDIRSEVTDITNLRTIQTMLRAEQEGKDRSSAVSRLEERRNAIQSDDIDTEDDDGASDDEVTEDVEGVEWSDADKNLISTLVETGKAESIEDAKEQILAL